ncbi:FkbM family methyltransferase [Methylomonas defluvii]|uniref:FkbM family methyltransferase n=1 Tax=Methylomonas defluvii TaxID=3045149 RepID=UPI0029F47842|nr:FkbM family methyltransferase [Methylomonas sp. OY6]
MRMLSRPGLFRKVLKLGLLRLFSIIENNNNCEFSTNGEMRFLDNLLDYFSGIEELIVFDVGANVGDYSQMFVDMANKRKTKFSLHVFEPTMKCFFTLQERFGCMTNIVLNKKALSYQEGVLSIYYDKEQSGLASLHKRNLTYYEIEMSESEKVEAVSAENYIHTNSVRHINFLKVDVEGHELQVLHGFGGYLSGDFIDFIQFEYGGANLDSHTSLMEIYFVLQNRGFTLTKVMANGLEVREYYPYMDNFSYANYVAISNSIIKSFQ